MAEFGQNDPVVTPTQDTITPSGGFGQADGFVPGMAPADIRPAGLTEEQDRRAREKAREMAEFQVGDRDSVVPRFLSPSANSELRQNSRTLGLGQKIQGLLESEILGGEGREFGEAVHRYYIEEMRNRSGSPRLQEFLGALTTPIGGGSAAANIGAAAATSGVQAAAEQLPSEANIRDVGVAAGVGGAVGAAFEGAGHLLARGTRPGTELTAQNIQGRDLSTVSRMATEQLGVPPNPAMAGNAFARTARNEVGNLYETGSQNIDRAVQSDMVLERGSPRQITDQVTGQQVTVQNIRPGRLLQRSVSDQGYGSVRRATNNDPIPVTPEGTPAAFALREIINTDYLKHEELTLRDVDQLRVRIRGLRTKAANATDRAALDDMETAINNTVQDMVSRGQLRGDPAAWSLYRQGRHEVHRVFTVEQNPNLARVLNNETVPGSVIASELFSLNSAAQRRRAARAVTDLSTGLGQNSESLASLRAGMLSQMLTPEDPRVLRRNLQVLRDDPELIEALFPPDVANQLTELAVNLDRVSDISPQQTRDLVGPVMEFAAQSMMGNNAVGRFTSRAMTRTAGPAAGLSIATGAMTGSPVAAVAAGGAAMTLQALASKPVRAVVGPVMRGTGPNVAREIANSDSAQAVANSWLEPYLSDDEMRQNITPGLLERP